MTICLFTQLFVGTTHLIKKVFKSRKTLSRCYCLVPTFDCGRNHLHKMVYSLVVHFRVKDDKDAIAKVKAKLVEASQVYSRDKETVSWFIMQSVFDERDFSECPVLS